MNDTTTATCAPHFDSTIDLRAIDEGRFAVDLDPSWASLRGVHGGYMAALAVRASERTAPGRAVRTVATSFLRPAVVGAAELIVTSIRSGRSLSTTSVELRQNERAVTNTRVTLLASVDGHDWAEPGRDRPAPLDACVPFTPPPSIPHFRQAELLIDPDTIPVGDGSAARVAGYVRPNDQRPVDAAWLTMIGDWFPPAPFRRFDPPTGGVSVDYTIHLHGHDTAPAEGWLEGVFVARTSAGGIALEQGTLAVPGGALVAETFHTRWTG